jgi:putative transposase
VNALTATLPDDSLLLSARDLAGLGVEGLPSTPRSINRLRERHGWNSHYHGGQHLIDVGSMPQKMRDAIEARRAALIAKVNRAIAAPITGRSGRGRPRGSNYFTQNPDIADVVRSIRADNNHAATNIRDMLESHFSDGIPLPSLRVLQRYLADLERDEKAALSLTRDPDWYNSNAKISLGRADATVRYAHQVWEVDTTPTDVILLGEDGKPTRFAILGVIDRWSRRGRLVLAKSESAQSVRALLVRAISDWNAVPTSIKTDRGSGYVNATILTACELLGIEHDACLPGNPRGKGFIERFFGTFTRARSAMIPGFVGHNVSQAQKIRARKKKSTGSFEIQASVTRDEFQAILDAWVIGEYEARVHSGTGQAPLVRAMQSPVPVPVAPNADTLKIILSARVGPKAVTKQGITWSKQRYFANELISYIGRTVEVRRDEDDLGALFIFDGDGTYLCTAVNHERSGFSEREFAMEYARQQKTWEKDAKAELRRVRAGVSIETLKRSVLRRDAELAGKLITLPAPVATAQATTPQPVRNAEPATIHHLPAPRTNGDIAARVARTEQLLADHESGHVIDPSSLALAQAFVTGPAYRAFKMQNSDNNKGSEHA